MQAFFGKEKKDHINNLTAQSKKVDNDKQKNFKVDKEKKIIKCKAEINN